MTTSPSQAASARRLALVTGGARRLGAAIVRALHTDGYDIAIHYHQSAGDARALAHELNSILPGSAFTLRQNLAARRAPQQILNAIAKKSPRLDLVVNNASVFDRTPIAEPHESAWDYIHAINARTPYFLSLAAVPLLRASRGAIVNILDIHTDRPRPDYAAYCASKANLAATTRSLAVEFAPHVRVNGVAPGAILWAQSEDGATRRAALRATPLHRRGEPDDIAHAVRYLASAKYVTGQIINVDGGRSLHV